MPYEDGCMTEHTEESLNSTRHVNNDVPATVDTACPSSEGNPANSAEEATGGAAKEEEEKARKSKLRKQRRHTVYLFFSFMSLGMVVAVHGPTFLDLVMILGVDIETGSFLFTSCSIGYIIGSVIGGIIFHKFNKEIVLFLAVFFMGTFTALVPWCKHLVLMCFMNALRGCMEGVLDADANAMIFYIWGKEAAPYMQTIQFAFGFGAIIAPLIAEPFLFKKQDELSVNTSSTLPPYLSEMNTMVSDAGLLLGNATFETEKTPLINTNASSLPVSSGDYPSVVYIPYLILGVFAALTAVPFLEMYWSYRKEDKKEGQKVAMATEEKSEQARHIPLTGVVRATFFVLIGVFYVIYACVEDTFTGFILTFVVKHLKWSKTNGSLITSAFWIAFSVGRFVAIGLAKFLTSWKMLVFDFVFFDLGFLALFLGVETSDIFCWVGTVVAGFAMGSVFPTGLTWIDEKIFPVTGIVSSFVLVSASIGMMANPILCAYLFETYTPMGFIYLLFAQALFCTLVFILMTLVIVWVRKKWKSRQIREGRGDNSREIPLGNQTLVVESTSL